MRINVYSQELTDEANNQTPIADDDSHFGSREEMIARYRDLQEKLTATQALAEQRGMELKARDDIQLRVDAEFENLRAELEYYKRDAERYRWLRPRLHSADWSYGDPPASVITFQWPEMPVGVGDALDAAIDAAKSEQEK